MKEDFLHYLWKQKLYSNDILTTNKGETVKVISPGEHNLNAGPDFLNAKIKIGDTLWAGNVEIHVKASDWDKHNHANDKNYNNVILHVVAYNDTQIERVNGEHIPALEIKCKPQVYELYLFLMNSKDWVSCESFISKINSFTIFQWKESLLVERLKEKSALIEERFIRTNKHWEETFYQTLAYNFGFKVNALAFEILAQNLPLNYLGKHKDQLNLIEALLFGQSGLLPENPVDDYTQQLINDYRHLAIKFQLKALNPSLWKFMRMRPGNFPTLRVAQFSQLIYKSNALLSKILEVDKFENLYQFFDVQASSYWDTHYTFYKESAKKIKKMGAFAIQNIIINTIAPFLFFYGSYHGKSKYVERTIDFLQAIPYEKNTITQHWLNLGVQVENAFDSQALIQLKNIYCKHRRCLNCRIGNQVIQHKY